MTAGDNALDVPPSYSGGLTAGTPWRTPNTRCQRERRPSPFECSFFLLIQPPYLQPFLDGNKRTARLAANLPFVIGNPIPLSFIDVPRELFLKVYLCVYELNRVEPLRDIFSWAYERSALRLGQIKASMGEPDPFRLKHRGTLRD